MAEDDDNRRLFDHFIISGLSDNPEELTPLEHECGNKPYEALAPITDIVVIFPGQGDKVPFGFHCIETTPSGYPADLNHGSIRTNSAFLCYRRGYKKPALVDIGVMDEGKKERPMEDSTVVQYTPTGRVANVSNNSSPLFFTYRRCKSSGPPHQLVITHIEVIIANKGESPPHTFFKIDKNLNKGVVGSDVYVCYKKAQSCCRRIAYKPAVLDQFPKLNLDAEENYCAQNVPMFCLPMGAVIESWSSECGPPEQLFSTCVLTDSDGNKYYGASLTFYEKYTKELTQHQKEVLSFDIDSKNSEELADNESINASMDDGSSVTTGEALDQLFFMNKSICIVSKHPFFECFRRFLYYLYQMSMFPQKVPIERYISHLMYEVPFPTPSRPRVLVQLGEELVAFENFDDSQVPLSGAQFHEVLKNMNVDNFIYAMTLALLEQKILIHSLRPWLLTVVSETICALIFPFHWQCPYVPQCPLPLAGVLQAPIPFIAGVDSRYFDLYEDPPGDVTCFDLDTSTVRYSDNKKMIKEAALPKKPYKKLKQALEAVMERIRSDEKLKRAKLTDGSGGDWDHQIQMRKASYELSIREAFLRFMCSIMDGYTSFLKPIRECPRNQNATDLTARFDLDGFLRARERSSLEFYTRFSATQSFNRFVEERSFLCDKVAYNAFFDECMQKYMTKSGAELLDRDLYSVNHTIVVPPPGLLNPKFSESTFDYSGFPNRFKHELFEVEDIEKILAAKPVSLMTIHDTLQPKLRLAAIRTKQEIRSSLEVASKWVQTYPTLWPRVLLFYSYSLWFMQLPSMLHVARNKLKVLRLAMTVLHRVNRSTIPLIDQVCYRLLMKLCGEYGYPNLAVDVLLEMRRLGIAPNAITYAIYHWAVMEGEWPSDERIKAINTWKRIRVRLEVINRFLAIKKHPNFVLQQTEVRELPHDLNATMDDTLENEPSFSIEDSLAAQSINSTPEPDSVSRDSNKTKEDEERERALEEQPFVMTIHPLPVKKNSEINDPLADPLTGSTHSTEDRKTKASSLTISPSREQFMREHSASPFAKEMSTLDSRLNKKSLNKGPSSWFRKLTNSPVVTTLMRSQTTEDIKCPDEDSKSTGNNELSVASIAMSPSFSSLVNSVKKHAKSSYDVMSQQGNVLLKKSGVNTFVKNLNKTYTKDSSFSPNSSVNEDSFLNGTIAYQDHYDASDPAFQLDSGTSGSLLPLDFWMKDLLVDLETNGGDDCLMDVTLCSATKCPRCLLIIYDEELTACWSVDDSNLNTFCPYCAASFAPSLKIHLERRQEGVRQSWYTPFQSREYLGAEVKTILKPPETLSVPFVSPLVLRREIETLLTSNILALSDPSLRASHPSIFWNLVYYLRRLDVATHIYTWISKNVHIRCIYDRPEKHSKTMLPLYLTNHANEVDTMLVDVDRSLVDTELRRNMWQTTTDNLIQGNLYAIMQSMIQSHRDVHPVTKTISLRSHFSIYREILFTALDYFKHNVDREQFDRMYETDVEKFSVQMKQLLDAADKPIKPISIACRRIFLPLDLV